MKIVEGQRIGKLVAQRHVGWRPNGAWPTRTWLCVCDCGGERTITEVDAGNARFNRSCGCDNPVRRRDHTGKQFGDWTAVSLSDDRRRWLCRCACGAEREVLTGHLTSGASKGCGCAKPAATAAAMTTHGYSANDPRGEYSIWCQMIGRCESPTNQGYRYYGGRGISVCPRWRKDFLAFLADMGERPSMEHTLDRIDVNGNYEPGNVRWATRKEQARNTRRNRFVVMDGERMTLAEAVERRGLNYDTVKWRLYHGRTDKEALR